ncbi:MAG: pyridoxamine 5'-phosphate oxidase [Actinomycetota bacterium]
MVDLARMRHEYEAIGIVDADFGPDPLIHFDQWLQTAIDGGLREPNAMVVATADADGQPWSRYVLLKQAGPAGFDFYTNYESNKSADLRANPRASLTFGWLELHRQVMVAGEVIEVPAGESDEYWAVRPRGSQLGGWASDQSRPLTGGRDELDRRYSDADARFQGDVPRPPHWGGWRVVPHTIEFWQGRQNRLHDRLRYRRGHDGGWDRTRLAP